MNVVSVAEGLNGKQSLAGAGLVFCGASSILGYREKVLFFRRLIKSKNKFRKGRSILA